jgi:hypothetical protein
VTTEVIALPDQPTLNAKPTRRPFRLMDAMILIAATAVASGVAIWIERASGEAISWSDIPQLFTGLFGGTVPGTVDLGMTGRVLRLVFALGSLALPFFVAWTLAIVPMRLLGPRPRFRRLGRQAGTMAAIAASLGIATSALQVACTLIYSIFGNQSDPLFFLALLGGVASYPGLSVFVAWMTLLVGGRWRAEPDWLDRAGRVFGAYWMIMGVCIPATILFLSEAG